MPLSFRHVALLTAPPLLWAGNIVLGRSLVPHVPPFALNSLRWTIALMVLVALGWRAVATPAARREVWRRWGYLLALGLLGAGGYNALQYLALVTSTSINVALITACMPVWMLIFGTLFFKEHPRFSQYLSAALSLIGVAIVLGHGSLAALRQVRFVPGDLLMLAATGCWAGYSWLLARPPAHMLGDARPRIEVNGVQRPWNWAEFLMLQSAFGLLWAGTATGVEAWVGDRSIVWSPGVVAGIVYIALGPSLVAYWCWGLAVAKGPQLAGFFSNLTPLFAAVLSTVLLGEAPQVYHGVAFVFIAGSIWVSVRH